jgi:hypothetical protein
MSSRPPADSVALGTKFTSPHNERNIYHNGINSLDSNNNFFFSF